MHKQTAEKSCCGQECDLILSSNKQMGNKLIKLFYRTKKNGIGQTIRFAVSKLCFWVSGKEKSSSTKSAPEPKPPVTFDEALHLQPGEMVEVRPLGQILSTLDETGSFKGLRWMSSQQKYCGKQLKVFKRLDTIILESTREIRRVKNTVLLEGALCDGEDWYGCDRSCFYFWREAWLKRV